MSDSPATVELTNPNRLLTADEFCQWVGISRRVFRKWVADGSAPRRIRVGRGVRIKASDALTWAETRYVEH